MDHHEKKPKQTEVTGHPDHFAWLAGALALAGADSLVRIESTHHEQLFYPLRPPDAISAIATGPTSDQFATGSYDGNRVPLESRLRDVGAKVHRQPAISPGHTADHSTNFRCGTFSA